MIGMRFLLASDMGNTLSIIGVILSLIIWLVGNKKKDRRIALFITGLVIAIIILLAINRYDIHKNYVQIPHICELTVDAAKVKLVDNGVDMNHVIFNSINSNLLPEGVTAVKGVDPDEGEIVKKTSVISILYEEGIKTEDRANTINPPKELIMAINEQLSDEGAALNEEDLRAFICMLNEDYEFINKDCFYRVLHAFINIDNASANLLIGIDDADDHMTSISAIYGAFFRENDSLFVEYWVTRFEELKRKIYLQEDMESIYYEIDEFGVDLYLTFCYSEPVQINNQKISRKELRKETVFFLQEFLMHRMVPYFKNIHADNSRQYLEMVDPATGENIMISVDTLMEGLTERANNTLREIAYKIQNKT